MAAGPLNFNAMPIDAYIVGLKKVTMNAAESVVSQVNKAFHVEPTDLYQQSEYSFAGIRPYQSWSGESETIPRQAIEKRYKSTFTQAFWATEVSYTYLNKKFLRYGLLKEQAQELGVKGVHSKELLAASFFNNGFTTVWNTTEAQYFFDSDHPLANGSTDSNLASGALTVGNLQSAITMLETTVDDMGLQMGLKAKRLWVHPDQYFTAVEVVNKGIAYRGDGDTFTKNAFNEWGLEIVVWPYLTTGYWLLQGDRYGTLWLPSVDMDQKQYVDDETNDTIHQAIFGVAYGARDWRGWVGSTGS